MIFNRESDFEEALIKLLTESKGWEKEVLRHPTEKDLIKNWADILYDNNQDIDRLNKCPLTDGEMAQILEQVEALRTPHKLNGFINGKTVMITRDNEKDTLHFGKEVSLKIYDRLEIAAGQSRYQIAQQPEFTAKTRILNDRRGDLMLLINGMPVIHIELKKSGIPVSQACIQIEKYAYEGVFTGLFSLVQIFVAMNPDETVYFSNPGPESKFNHNYYFHWANYDNEPINDWKAIASTILSIPMAHQMVGFYTVPDDSDGTLKVMRSYQYFAASAISDKVSKIKWGQDNQLGGFVWHTTGSGKTMTSFKSAQLIANSNDADKVVFLTDRVELGTQSIKEYRGFADENESVQETENTEVLIDKLKSSNPSEILIVTSIQKMSRIREEENGLNAKDIEIINKKRLVFIVDEAHRSTFGDMLITIKDTFRGAIFFGFTGTPIHEENKKKLNTTVTVFGDELHRYSIADGIRDKNVLGFDPVKVLTYKDSDLRKIVALQEAKAKTSEEAMNDSVKAAVYYDFMNASKVPMAGYYNDAGKYVKGIEDYVPNAQYQTEGHKKSVVKDIVEYWRSHRVSSRGNRFHGIFATGSIPEAIEYYRLLKEEAPELKTTCLFDPNIDNVAGFEYKEDGLVEVLKDYNKRYDKDYTIATHAAFKKDVSFRLAHKEYYKRIETTPDEELDILIVVNQMLTGFDSKWVNVLYMDKMLEYENIIQAFSRTNRLFGEDKPFGTIRYYRRPHTMERNINAAVKLYSGDKPLGLFVNKIKDNIDGMNHVYEEIEALFCNSGMVDFSKLPESGEERAKFASLFKELNKYMEAARVQGFRWDKFVPSDGTETADSLVITFGEDLYLAMLQRYKELSSDKNPENEDKTGEVPYDLANYLMEIDTGMIDAAYMNSRFDKYLKLLNQEGASEELLEEALDELHRTFATLTQEEQKCANIFLHDVQRGDVIPEEGMTLRDYITEYQSKAKNDKIHDFACELGLDEDGLRGMMRMALTIENINEFNRFDKLMKTVDINRAKVYVEKLMGVSMPPHKVRIQIDRLLREFILNGGFET